MSETDQILMNTAARLFDDLITPTVLRDADAGGWPAEVWQAIEDVGLPLALVPEDHGGFGVSPQAALAVVRAAAHGAAPVPLPETMLAHRLLALAGMEAPTGPLAVAPLGKDDRIALSRTPAGMRVSGQATRVPWGRHATAVVLIADCDGRPHVVLATAADVKAGSNLAGEPRDDLSFDAILAETAVGARPRRRGRRTRQGLRRRPAGQPDRWWRRAAPRHDRAICIRADAIRPSYRQVPGGTAKPRGSGGAGRRDIRRR